MRPRSSADVERFLPLTPVAFEILIALAAGDQHGYSIMQEVERRSEGRIVLHPGTLYRALGRLLDSGLIQEIDDRPAPDVDDQRRRYYQLTPLGRRVAKAEARRLERLLADARATGLLPKRG